MVCPLCNSALKNSVDAVYYRCSCCDALVMDKAKHPDAEAEYAHYLTHNNDVEDPRYQAFVSPIVNYIVNNRQAEEQGLDFGSGSGPVISKLLTDQGYQIKQYDPFFANKPDLLKTTYDYIVCCEVIEHFYQPAVEFRRLRRLLQPAGVFVCMTSLYTPDIDFSQWRYRKDPTHTFIYTAATLAYIAANFGFAELKISGRLQLLFV